VNTDADRMLPITASRYTPPPNLFVPSPAQLQRYFSCFIHYLREKEEFNQVLLEISNRLLKSQLHGRSLLHRRLIRC
jgi:hypothetical protein